MKPSPLPPLYLLAGTICLYLAATFHHSVNADGEQETANRPAPPASSEARADAAQQDTANGQPPATNSSPTLQTRWGEIGIFPPDNPWNQDISHLPVHELSSVWLRTIGFDQHLHPDFGTVYRGTPNGIPFNVIPSDQPGVAVSFEYADESDAGTWPIPQGVLIEGGPQAPHDSDRHIILIDPQRRRLYELFQAIPDPVTGWHAGSGAIFDLASNDLRPLGWTSADAAGLPVFPGLARYDEVAAGAIRHALRFTVERTQRAFIHPARHFASRSNDPNLPPMGLRVRLRADYDVSRFPPTARVILTALKRYGLLLADNGSNFFISGSPDPRWNDDELATLKRITGRDLECVETGPLMRGR